ncbi:MAG: DUF3014 domain-containing protein [Gammaproteobacteria bacterium]|nr:DUF3014 domain-containing protein [Gammaproteobacteria bacterium]MBQ0838897.1 DUF3014 domain-containing protein [Gammaproteobacteria bacterium]
MPLAPNDPLVADGRHHASPANARVGLLIIAFSLLAATIYFLYSNHLYRAQEPDQTVEIVTSPEPALQPEPTPIEFDPLPTVKIPPLYFDAAPSKPSAPPLPPLPAYEKANSFVTAQLTDAHWRGLNINPQNLPALNKDFVLQRSVAFLDGLSKGALVDKLQPFARPTQTFVADKQGQALSMGASNFQRYDAFAQSIVAIDSKQAAAFFHWTRPLLETAYSELGYPAENLGGAVIGAIDSLLATPTLKGPIALKRESVLYQYADPSLEALPGAQKQLLRMGAKNTALLQSWLRELRSALLATNNNH